MSDTKREFKDLIETEFMNELMFRVPMLKQLDVQSAAGDFSGYPEPVI